MPEGRYLPIPKKLSSKGLKDMVRISDARMSGTAFGTIVLHVTPEAAAGGPLALVRTGDRIRLSVKDRRIDLLVDEAELARRRTGYVSAQSDPKTLRGYDKLYAEQVLQADQGCDFGFMLKPEAARSVGRSSHATQNAFSRSWKSAAGPSNLLRPSSST